MTTHMGINSHIILLVLLRQLASAGMNAMHWGKGDCAAFCILDATSRLGYIGT